jgi:hypothetical protein
MLVCRTAAPGVTPSLAADIGSALEQALMNGQSATCTMMRRLSPIKALNMIQEQLRRHTFFIHASFSLKRECYFCLYMVIHAMHRR